MHAPVLHSSYENSTTPTSRVSIAGFFTTHPVLPVLRGLLITGLLWTFLVFVLYGVYLLVAGK